MEKALFGESSGGRDGLLRRIDKSTSKLTRRSDAITHGSPFQKAAALVDLAEDGMGIPEEILDQENFESVAKFYFIFIRFDIIWTLNYFAMIVLNFLEKPLWCQNNSAHSCNDREYFYLGQLTYLTAAESFVYEGITVIILVAHIFFPLSYEGFPVYWKNPLNWLKVIFLCILVVDLVAYAIYASPVAFNFLPLRIAPYIRVVFLILHYRDLQTSIIILGGVLKTYVNVLALGLLFLLFSSWLAYVMFDNTWQGKIVFTSYGTTLYQMLILFTTSNNPDVWIPAYKIRYLLVARSLRLIRILMYVKSYRAFLATFLDLIPSLMPYLGTIFCVMCIYCSLGIQIFGGVVNAGNPNLEGTDLAQEDYLLFNFNDYPNGMVTLFNLLVMENWQVWMQSYKDLTGTYWSTTYFISFYLITVLLLLNLVMAFVLEAFFAEMEVEASEKCEGEDKEGSNSKSRRRYVLLASHFLQSRC